MRPDHLHPRAGANERGTASMEALLCLPFVLLIFALVINVGYGWLARIHAQGAARFAGNDYISRLSLGIEAEPARRASRQAARTLWYPDEEEAEIRLSGAGSRTGGILKKDGLAATLADLGARITGRQHADVQAPRRPPTGTLVPPTPVSTAYRVDGNPWTHAEIPLTFDGLTDAGKHNDMPAGISQVVSGLSFAAEGFFWLLGMEP